MRNINKVIRCSKVSKEDWKRILESYLKNYRATPHSLTGVSPNQLMQFENENGMISSNATSNINFKQIAFENDFKSKQNQKFYADNYLNTKLIKFVIGDIVKLKWNRSHSKYTPLLDNNNYIITHIKNTMITATNGTKPITRNSSFFQHAKAGNIPNLVFDPLSAYEDNRVEST